jgi:hypothetical protein
MHLPVHGGVLGTHIRSVSWLRRLRRHGSVHSFPYAFLQNQDDFWVDPVIGHLHLVSRRPPSLSNAEMHELLHTDTVGTLTRAEAAILCLRSEKTTKFTGYFQDRTEWGGSHPPIYTFECIHGAKSRHFEAVFRRGSVARWLDQPAPAPRFPAVAFRKVKAKARIMLFIPEGLVAGHVDSHLQAFISGILGLDIAFSLSGKEFLRCLK